MRKCGRSETGMMACDPLAGILRKRSELAGVVFRQARKVGQKVEGSGKDAKPIDPGRIA
jgi:hypothetical protein